MKTYKSQLKIDSDIIDNKLVIDDDITFECSFVTTASIICRNIIAGDIVSGAIYVWSITAVNIIADGISADNDHPPADEIAKGRYYDEKERQYWDSTRFFYIDSIVAGHIVTGNIYADNIFCLNIKAANIRAGDIKALDINACSINAKGINACYIFSTRIRAYDIIALDIVVDGIYTPDTLEDDINTQEKAIDTEEDYTYKRIEDIDKQDEDICAKKIL
jgi:hypothetical protein